MIPSVKSTLIVSTYNWPEALKHCLFSIKAQSVLPDEVIIADDGSRPETALVIEQMSTFLPIPVIHVWHADDGFQLARIRNKAIARASHEYIIQIDGDLILHKHFIKDHLEICKRGTFVAGSRVMLTQKLTNKLINQAPAPVNILQSGVNNRMNGLRFKYLRNYFAPRYNAKEVRKLRGCNIAFWKDDLLAVNGYNEMFRSWGREDNEIAARLVNAGITKQFLKFGGVTFHIFHREHVPVCYKVNETILANTINQQLQYCEHGLNQYTITKSETLPLISIIIVTLNAALHLQRCLNSIFIQLYPFLEIIVIDGASTDRTTDILSANTGKIKYWVSEKDNGVYDAMNKAVSKANGQWVYFLGSDDELTQDFSMLAHELKDLKTIYYGSVWKRGKKYLGELSAYKHAKTGINHQAMIYPASVFKKYKYDTRFVISADHILNMWCWKDPEYTFKFKDYVIATFSTAGISSLYKDRLFENQKASLILKNYGIIIWLRFLYKKAKESFSFKPVRWKIHTNYPLLQSNQTENNDILNG